MINGNACFAYFNKIWGIPEIVTDEGIIDATKGELGEIEQTPPRTERQNRHIVIWYRPDL